MADKGPLGGAGAAEGFSLSTHPDNPVGVPGLW